jgi:hypothetical protein
MWTSDEVRVRRVGRLRVRDVFFNTGSKRSDKSAVDR